MLVRVVYFNVLYDLMRWAPTYYRLTKKMKEMGVQEEQPSGCRCFVLVLFDRLLAAYSYSSTVDTDCSDEILPDAKCHICSICR